MRFLYHTPLSTCCRKIRMALREKGLEFSLRQETQWVRAPQPLGLYPAGEVPVLVEEDGTVVAGAYAIAEYLEDAYAEPALLGGGTEARAEVRRLVQWFDRRMGEEVTQPVLFEKVLKRSQALSAEKRAESTGAPDAARLRAARGHLGYHLDYIGHLAGERYFLAGEALTLADLAAAAHLSALDYLGDVPWEEYPAAAQWYALMKSRPSVRAVLADRIHGVRPPAYYENPDF